MLSLDLKCASMCESVGVGVGVGVPAAESVCVCVEWHFKVFSCWGGYEGRLELDFVYTSSQAESPQSA